MRAVGPGEELEAPGILENPVPVDALYDWEVGQEVTLRNLLQRHGYESLEAVEATGEAAGRAEGEIETSRSAVLDVLEARGLAAGEGVRLAVVTSREEAVLRRWLRRAATIASTGDLFAEEV
ncbi:MAG: hypothetical protein GY719_00180 [bacterium]|nr:hypothetical protein [bacterium]